MASEASHPLATPLGRLRRSATFPLFAPRGGEGRGDVGEAAAPTSGVTHLTLPVAGATGPLPLSPPAGGEGEIAWLPQARQELIYDFFSASAATCILMILSGLVTLPLRAESPFLILSIYSMPEVTLPQMVYWPSSDVAGPNIMKNWLSALFGSEERAIETTPRTCFSSENSALSLCPDPPVPSPFGSPV